MTDLKKLSDPQVNQALEKLPGWELRDGKLHRDFRFPDFVTAFAFMAGCAALAEKLAHHPEWFNVYKFVKVDLTTHDVGGISELDLTMARKMSDLAEKLED